jgi:ABC-2 type transport system permease protein
MRLASLADCTYLAFKADFLTWIRYRNAFLGQIGGIVLQVASYYYLARAIGPGFRPDGVAYFPFLLIGLGVSAYLLGATTAFVRSVRDAQISGTFEILMSTSTPGPLVVLLMGFSSFTGQVFNLTIYMTIGLVLGSGTTPAPNIAGAVVIFVLSMAVTVAIGIVAATVQILTQKGDSILVLVALSTTLLGGALFPVSALPGWLQSLARANPLLYCLDGLRLALLRGASFGELALQIEALAICSVVLLPLSLLLLEMSLRRARQLGTLSYY